MFDIKKISQLKLRDIYIVFVVALLTTGCQAQSKVAISPTNNSATVESIPVQVKPDSEIKFSSVYTKLNSKTCKPLWKPENEQDEPSELCTGYKGYKIYIQMHGISRFWVGREISKDLDSWKMSEMPSFLFSGGEPTLEWRLADGEPFALIVRAEYDKQLFQPYEPGMANELGVQNLRGFAPISVSIDATKNKNANEDARAAADAGYRKL